MTMRSDRSVMGGKFTGVTIEPSRWPSGTIIFRTLSAPSSLTIRDSDSMLSTPLSRRLLPALGIVSGWGVCWSGGGGRARYGPKGGRKLWSARKKKKAKA